MRGCILFFLHRKPSDSGGNSEPHWSTSVPFPGLTNTQILSQKLETSDSSESHILVVYHVSDIHVDFNPALQALLQDAEGDSQVVGCHWQKYEELNYLERPDFKEATSPPLALVVSVGFTILQNTETLQDFNSWYDREHLPGMATVPGWRKGTRYQLLHTSDGDNDSAPTYVTLHEWNHENELGGEIWKRVVFTAWTQRILSYQTKPMWRKTWSVVQ